VSSRTASNGSASGSTGPTTAASSAAASSHATSTPPAQSVSGSGALRVGAAVGLIGLFVGFALL
jgi:hypothetical protein